MTDYFEEPQMRLLFLALGEFDETDVKVRHRIAVVLQHDSI